MSIHIRHANELDPDQPLGESYDLAVVIDVIRAFTVAPWVLRQGATRLFLARDAATALRAHTRFPEALLMKDGAPDPRFALSNAPGQMVELDLAGRTVIQTTRNGTRGAHLVRDVPVVACASFVTASATARLISRHDRVLLVPTEGEEDDALADFLVARALGQQPDVDALLHRAATSAAGIECVERGQSPAYPGVHPLDLTLCLGIDEVDHALVANPAGELLEVTRA